VASGYAHDGHFNLDKTAQGPLDSTPNSALAADQARPTPPRVLGFTDLFLFYVVTGISLRWLATAAHAGPSSIVVWWGAWLCFYVPLALSVVELATRYPQEGGLYVWSKQAFGDFAGYICAWTYWTSNLPYFPAVLYFAASNVLYMGGEKWIHHSDSPSYYIWFSLSALAAIFALNLVGLGVGKWLNNIGAFGMWVPAVIIVIMGFISWFRFGPANSFTASSFVPRANLKDMIFWASLTFALGGCEAASFMGEEVKSVRRNLPKALLLSGLVVVFCYMVGTVAVLLAVPRGQVSDLQGVNETIRLTAAHLGWTGVVPLAVLLLALGNLGAAGAFLGATARLPFVVGIDRYLPPAFGRLHPRWQTPYVALAVQTGIAGIFVLLGQAGTSVKGAYDVLVSMGIITYFIPYLFVFAAMFKLQWEDARPDAFRVPGRKPVALLLSSVGFATTLVTIGLSLIPSPDEPNKLLAAAKVIGLSAILVGTGAVLYYLGTREASTSLKG
jgi:glutamate:GABA antiporter